jgi:hypothetical protein
MLLEEGKLSHPVAEYVVKDGDESPVDIRLPGPSRQSRYGHQRARSAARARSPSAARGAVFFGDKLNPGPRAPRIFISC